MAIPCADKYALMVTLLPPGVRVVVVVESTTVREGEFTVVLTPEPPPLLLLLTMKLELAAAEP